MDIKLGVVVMPEPAGVARRAVHLTTNTTLRGGSYDIDGGEQVVSGSGA